MNPTPATFPRLKAVCILACILACTLLIGCSSDTAPTQKLEQRSLAGTAWQITEMWDVVTGSDMSSPVNPDLTFEFELHEDGTLTGRTPLNDISGTWTTDDSAIRILLDERKITEAEDEFFELQTADFSMGTSLVNATKFLVGSDGATLSLFDSSGRMLLKADELK